MLLNEFLKAHRKVEEQQDEVREQEATVAERKVNRCKAGNDHCPAAEGDCKPSQLLLRAQAAQIQKVSDQLALSKACTASGGQQSIRRAEVTGCHIRQSVVDAVSTWAASCLAPRRAFRDSEQLP